MNQHLCPVCGFNKLKEPPFGANNEPSHEICPCCGFEFGFDDANKAGGFNVFRVRWIQNGAKWFTPNSKPIKWDLKKQLENLKNQMEKKNV